MFSFIKEWFKPNIEPMNRIYISRSDILYNYKYLQSLKPNADIFPVLKSNAYGHGIDQILDIYKWLPIKYIVVDSFPEYNIVRRHSKFNVLVMWETLPVNYDKFNFKRATFCVYNLETLQALAKLNKKLKIHLFLNTWMNREWIDADLLPNALEYLKNHPKIEIEWVMSQSAWYRKTNQRFQNDVYSDIGLRTYSDLSPYLSEYLNAKITGWFFQCISSRISFVWI